MLTTFIKGMHRAPTGSLLACLLVALVAGCGGGPGDGEFPQVEEPAVASRAFEIVARTGPIVGVRVGQTANLNDLNSYTSSEQPLSYQWSFSSKPDGSNAALQFAAGDGFPQVLLDGTAVAIASGGVVGPLSSGSHTVIVTSTDWAGNAGSASATFTIIVPQTGDVSGDRIVDLTDAVLVLQLILK